MKKIASVNLVVFFGVLSCTIFLSCRSRAADLPANFFDEKILPVLESKCYKCHSAKTGKSKGGLQLDSPNRLKLGGETGPALAPGNASDSLLITAIQYDDPDYEMPPKGKLPDSVIADFVTWINAGAPDPRKPQPVHDAAFLANQNSAITPKMPAELWSFRPPKLITPAPTQSAWPRTNIDRYIFAELEARKLSSAPDATPATLLRRVYFDLIGLPPTPQNLADFLADKSPNPIANVIDELLASKNFGERWARHWLDVARYAESNGGDSNVTYPHAFRYRDYVINAFNADIPYSDFIQQQIAGDLLQTFSTQQKTQNTVATGFLAIGHKNLNERNFTQFQLDLVDEQIDAVSRAFLGLTVACARCHDHKFDPISAEDYYAMAGIFTSSNSQYGTLHTTDFNNNSTGLIPIQVNDATKTTGSITPAELENIKRRLADTQSQLRALRPSGGRSAGRGPAPQSNNGMDAVQLRRSRLRLNMTYDALEAQLYDYDAQGAALTHAMAVVESRPQNSPLYFKGEASNPGPAVPRGFLQSLPISSTPTIPAAASGRLQLAQWITSPSNPLTSRVIVNRIWAQLFGSGLVTTLNNFGAMGQAPSHPKLLDALALEFRDSGGSMKQFIRTLMLTRTYQLASSVIPENYDIDPGNTFLWRATPRPIDAEILRDTVLYLAGSLASRPLRSQTYDIGDTPLGGRRGFRIERFNFDVNYRSIYLPILRDYLPDSLSLFDFADPSMIVGQRDATIVPSQALFMLNSDFVQTQAAYFASWVIAENKTTAERIRFAYQWTLTRQPSASELKNAQSFLTRYAALIKNENSTQEALAAFIQSLFASAEFRYLN